MSQLLLLPCQVVCNAIVVVVVKLDRFRASFSGRVVVNSFLYKVKTTKYSDIITNSSDAVTHFYLSNNLTLNCVSQTNSTSKVKNTCLEAIHFEMQRKLLRILGIKEIHFRNQYSHRIGRRKFNCHDRAYPFQVLLLIQHPLSPLSYSMIFVHI